MISLWKLDHDNDTYTVTHHEMIPGFKMEDVPWAKAPAPRVAPAAAVRVETLQSQAAGEPKGEAKDTKPRSEVRNLTQETLVYQANDTGSMRCKRFVQPIVWYYIVSDLILGKPWFLGELRSLDEDTFVAVFLGRKNSEAAICSPVTSMIFAVSKDRRQMRSMMRRWRLTRLNWPRSSMRMGTKLAYRIGHYIWPSSFLG